MAGWKITLEYDGSKYRGWQEQKNARSLQGEFRHAAEIALGGPVEVQAAGRTDAGVHALGQVVHLRPVAAAKGDRRESATGLLRSLNDALPADMAVLEVKPAPPRFHARHDAQSRRYLYRIALQKSAFAKKYAWWIKAPLNREAMDAAAALLPGRHDFIQFRAPDPARQDDSTLVQVDAASFSESAGMLCFYIEASHFLWKMNRRVVGALVKVGLGEVSLEEFSAQLHPPVVAALPIAEWTAPAAGLFLEAVRYRDDPPELVQSQPHGHGDTSRLRWRG